MNKKLLFLLPMMISIVVNPAFAQHEPSMIGEKTYDTDDGKFEIHYSNVNEEYAMFVGHAFSKAREFQLALGFNDIVLVPDTHGSDAKAEIYVEDLIYDGKAAEAVIDQSRLQRMLVSDKPDKFDKWQIYLGAAHCYFEAVLASYNTAAYEATEEYRWIKEGIAKFIVLYTALNDPEYKEYDPDYKQYGYLNNVMVEGKKTYDYAPYQVPTITSEALQQNSITNLGPLSVSYWYYLHKLYGMQVIEDVIAKSGSYNDDSVEVVSSVLANYNTTFEQSVAGWYESIGFWNKGKMGEFSVYEGLMLVNNEVFKEQTSSELPFEIDGELSRYGASLVSLNFDSHGPLVQLRFLNPGEAVHLYVYIHNVSTDEYFLQKFQVERGYQDFWVWTENAEINFIVIGGDKTFRAGYTISAV